MLSYPTNDSLTYSSRAGVSTTFIPTEMIPPVRLSTCSNSELSFNLLLSDPASFEGGGTCFITELEEGKRPEEISATSTVRPCQGEMLSHFGRLYHSGIAVTHGTRHILAGFVSVQSLAANWRELRLDASAEEEDEGIGDGSIMQREMEISTREIAHGARVP